MAYSRTASAASASAGDKDGVTVTRINSSRQGAETTKAGTIKPPVSLSAYLASSSVDHDHDGDDDDGPSPPKTEETTKETELADELDYISVAPPSPTVDSHQFAASDSGHFSQLVHSPRDKASRILGIRHRTSMEPIPASARTSVASTRSAPVRQPQSSSAHTFTPTTPLTSLYVVSGLPKSPHTWTLADPDSVLGLSHSDGAVSRWWRAEVLGSTVSPGAGGGMKKQRRRAKGGAGSEADLMKGAGALGKQEVGKMLSKALKLSFTREVEIIASTLQPASTVHTFSFSLPAPANSLAPSTSAAILRNSAFSASSTGVGIGGGALDRPISTASNSLYPYSDPYTHARPSSAYLGPQTALVPSTSAKPGGASGSGSADGTGATVTYHGVCLTVWSHADGERSAAIRRTLEASRSRKESAQSLATPRMRNASDPGGLLGRRSTRRSARAPWGGGGGALTDGETDMDAETDGAVSESDFDAGSVMHHNPGESTLFLPGDTVFWLPYALTLVSRHPIYDLMRDYLTLSWARFSKDVQSHTLQISKILAHPAPRAGDLVRLDASAAGPAGGDTSLEVIARFPGGLDFGRGLVDINFTMWPLFKALNVDNILTACEIALAPTGRVLFFSRHPAMLGIAVSTVRYLVELRGWSGVALQAVHARDAKIYTDDPGPWLIGLATEARYAVRPPPEVCIIDLDINYLSCASPPPGAVSTKTVRERARQRLLQAFEPHYHPDYGVPAEFKEAFPAGRFRPVCKIQAKRGASSAAVADTIRAPEWWHSTRVIQAFDEVLQERARKPSFLKRLSSPFGASRRRPTTLSSAERHIQQSIRKRATAFVDARDELETKIGRLSRRLNFLMTESDLWRDKFVTFEQYAEKLSSEANELRSKIGKEQRETKRLSGLVTLTAAEKAKLQADLRQTESAHKDALRELQQMRETMEVMEQERAEMVAEVEAQIERALASMAVDIDAESDYDSRPSSRLSSTTTHSRRARSRSRHREPSDTLRSFGTESTLADAYASYDGDGERAHEDLKKTALLEVEEEEEIPLTPSRAKRFSAAVAAGQQDGMMQAVDEGISSRSGDIAMKVAQIQQKLETALVASDGEATGGARRPVRRQQDTYQSSDGSESERAYTRRPQRATRGPATRKRSGTASSRGNTSATETVAGHASRTASKPRSDHSRPSPDEIHSEASSTPIQVHSPTTATQRLPRLRKIASNASVTATSPTGATHLAHTPTTPALTPATDESSDTDFQSAYSHEGSPRASTYGADADPSEAAADYGEAMRMLGAPAVSKPRNRLSSVITVGPGAHEALDSPTFSDRTVSHSLATPALRR